MSNEPKREARRKKIIDTMKAGEVPTPEALQVSRATLWRDLKALQEQAVLTLDTEGLKAITQQQYQVQLKMEEALLQGVLDPATVIAWNKVRESIAKLLGLNAPSRSIQAHISAKGLPDYGPAAHPELWKIHEACVDLSGDQIAEVVKFAKGLRRGPVIDGEIRYVLPEWINPHGGSQ